MRQCSNGHQCDLLIAWDCLACHLGETVPDSQGRTELLLELQSRFTPEEAARISYTSSDILVSIALSIVRDRHEAAENAKRLSLIINVVVGLLVSVAIIAIYMFFSQEAPKPVKADAKAEPRVAPAAK